MGKSISSAFIAARRRVLEGMKLEVEHGPLIDHIASDLDCTLVRSVRAGGVESTDQRLPQHAPCGGSTRVTFPIRAAPPR